MPNEAHGDKCDEHRADVEAALAAAVGSPITIVIGEGRTTTPITHRRATRRRQAPRRRHRRAAARRHRRGHGTAADDVRSAATDDDIDPDELTDAPPEAVLTPIDRLAQAFPGSELVIDDRD